MLVVMICVMLRINNSAEVLGNMNENISVLIGLKREINEDIVFVMKAKTQIKDALPSRNIFQSEKISNHFIDSKCCTQLKLEKI